jgi:hypothetical protein
MHVYDKQVYISKVDESIVYVNLYGLGTKRRDRFLVMNALENYFSRYGKIKDVGRLKQKYSYLGDFFIIFENFLDGVKASAYHAHRGKVYLPDRSLPEYMMEVW